MIYLDRGVGGGNPFRLIRRHRWVGWVVAGKFSGPYHHVEHHTDLPAPDLDSSSSPSFLQLSGHAGHTYLPVMATPSLISRKIAIADCMIPTFPLTT